MPHLEHQRDHFVSNEEVLRRAGVDDIKSMLIRSRLHWLGHICRMDDARAPKQLMYGELVRGSCPVGRPKLRFKDTCKNALKCGDVLKGWRSSVNCRQEWRSLFETVETIPRSDFLHMKGEGHLGGSRDKTVYFTRLLGVDSRSNKKNKLIGKKCRAFFPRAYWA